MKTYILYHSPCYDGFGAAFVAWKCLGDKAEYIPVRHGDPPPILPEGAIVTIVDFSYPRETLLEMKKNNPDLLVLDHHVSAQKDLEGLDFAEFDMSKSGAVMAWERFYLGEKIPDFILYLQDRDLWKFELPQSLKVSVALRAYPLDFKVWDNFCFTFEGVGRLIGEGDVILRFQKQIVDLTCKNASMWKIGGFENVPVVNATAFWSETGQRLLELRPDAPFSAVYYTDITGNRVWQLRSRKEDGVDVSMVAKNFGGGGHKNAAGFQQSVAQIREI